MGTPANGAPRELASQDSNIISRINEALSVVHSTRSTNEARREASAYLEELKADKTAPFHGFRLASDKAQEPVVRHFALSLLENAIKHFWYDYADSEAESMKGWVLQLSEQITAADPLYIRNKTAQLWVEVAKRSWGQEWQDMDQLLVQLWGTGSVVHKEFVLFVLENLSDEVFSKEDGTVAMREAILSKACVDIFTPAQVLQEHFPNRTVEPVLRSGPEGWLVRLSLLLGQCLEQGVYTSDDNRSCALKTLAVIKSVLPWVTPKAVVFASCVDHLCQSLATPNVQIQLAAVEAMHALYSRSHLDKEEFDQLIAPVCTTPRIELFRTVYQYSIVDAEDIDDEKYLLCKKFSEMLSKVGNYVDINSKHLPLQVDLTNLLNLFFSIVQNQSFVVAIPVLVTWTHLLRSTIIITQKASHLIAPLLQLCSERLVRYENLPEDSEDPSHVLLLEDIDTIPERHAFLGNYRRYNVSVIELIVRNLTADAIHYILPQVLQSLSTLYDKLPAFAIATYAKNSLAILQVDAQFTVVEAALKGYIRWRDGPKQENFNETEHLSQKKDLENTFQMWCEKVMVMNFQDPIIRMRVMQLMVQFATVVLPDRSNFMFTVLESLLTYKPSPSEEPKAYADAVKEFQIDALHQLQRLAVKLPDSLFAIYDQLSAKVNEIIASGDLDEKQITGYQVFLFTINHRAAALSHEERMTRLTSFVTPVIQSWQNPDVHTAATSFQNFCEMLGLGKVIEYLVTNQVHKVEDWGTLPLDAQGIAYQAELTERMRKLPLRLTKAFLGASTDKIPNGCPAWEVSRQLWAPSMSVILPDLLKFLEHSQAFNNSSSWASLPQEMLPIVPRILTDRFWQAGISGGSRDEFFARVNNTKHTMEGLASSIRGTVRAVREAAYQCLYGLSRLDSDFYGFPGLPAPLSQALFASAEFLSSNQLITLMGLTKSLVDECPLEFRNDFIPPVVAAFFPKVDLKMAPAWASLNNRQQVPSDEEGLTKEMKEESLLRQLTNQAVLFVAALFDPHRTNETYTPKQLLDQNGEAAKYPIIRRFCLSSPQILEPVLLFSSHAIRFRDTRSVSVILRVFRSIVPEFASQRDPNQQLYAGIREFISTEVLKATIESLHDEAFVDSQKEIAQLIGTIIASYSALTQTPRNVLSSLPGVDAAQVDKAVELLGISRTVVQPRQQRGLVLELLKDFRGVGISELGKVKGSDMGRRREREKVNAEWLVTEEQRLQRVKEKMQETGIKEENIEGMGDLFNVPEQL